MALDRWHCVPLIYRLLWLHRLFRNTGQYTVRCEKGKCAASVQGEIILVYELFTSFILSFRIRREQMVQQTPHEFAERYWGSYRPGSYFGLKTRDPDSLVTGLMWFSPLRLGSRGEGIR